MLDKLNPFESWKRIICFVMICAIPNFWPPNSPDISPMNYFVSGTVEKDTNSCISNTKAQLMNKIKIIFDALLGRL